MDDSLRTLLAECRSWIADKRLESDEFASRRRRETKQEHADRLATNIEMNCNRDDLLKAIAVALGEQDAESPGYTA